MHRRALLLCIPLLVAAAACRRRFQPPRFLPVEYPATRTVDKVDDYFGVEVADPYRWLEDSGSDEVQAWVDAQNELTARWLARAGRTRRRLRERLERLWDFEKVSPPWREGSRYFYRRNEGLQEQSVLLVSESLDDEPRVLIDPNALSDDGTVALAGTSVSPDGRYVAYGLRTAGSDWIEMRVRDVATGADLEADRLDWIKFSEAGWLPDGSGFYYSRYPAPEPGTELQAPNLDSKLYFHRVGTAQADDRLAYERPDHPEWGLGGWVTDDGRWLVVEAHPQAGGGNAIFVRDLAANGPVKEFVPGFEAHTYVLGNEGDVVWLFTDRDAPNGRVVAVDANEPQPEHWTELIPEGREPIRSVQIVGDRFVVHSLHLATSRVRLHHLDGTLDRELPLPGRGSAGRFTGRRAHRETFFGFGTFTFPPGIYRYDFDTEKTTLWRRAEVAFDPDLYETDQVAYRSRDGVQLTMFLVQRKETPRDGRNPTLLTGYGGFGVSLTPHFSPVRIAWLELGGVLAVPNLRGGGEYGEKWHRAGMRGHKQAVFDDFIAAAEALVYNRVTRPERLAIEGGSNGGLLVGACLTQRPDLFAAALPGRGVLDMLRYHRFTVGRYWTAEYGSSDEREMFPVLLRYSPYHNVRPGVAYPATLISTGDHDDRVVPAHSYKFAARLQAAQAGRAPILLRVQRRTGHGAGTPTSMRLDAAADRLTFLARVLKIRVPRHPGR